MILLQRVNCSSDAGHFLTAVLKINSPVAKDRTEISCGKV